MHLLEFLLPALLLMSARRVIILLNIVLLHVSAEIRKLNMHFYHYTLNILIIQKIYSKFEEMSHSLSLIGFNKNID